MKEMKKILYMSTLVLSVFSCGEQEVSQYDVFGEETLIKFNTNTSNLDVTIDSEGVVEVPISVSTYATVDRTIIVETLAFPEGTVDAAQPNQYTFDGSVTIPANELTGILEITGLDVGIEAGQNLRLQVKIAGASFDNFSVDGEFHTVNITQVCPIPEDYLIGTYVLSSPIANIWCSNPRPSFIGDGILVDVVVGNFPTERIFRAKYAPGSCEGFNGPYDFSFSLSCGFASLSAPLETGVSCSSPLIVIANDPNRPSTYSTDDDSQITINVIDDINGSCTDCCGAPFTNQSFTLTKQ